MDFSGRVVAITGAASGIGAAAARLFAERSAGLILGDRDSAGKRIADELGGRFIDMDVTREADGQSLVQAAIDEFGRLDALVNSAGVVLAKSTTETEEEEWDRVLDVNLKGTWLCSKAAIPQMRPGGAIVNVASNAALVGFANAAAYCASKGGVAQLTKAMALDCAHLGIRVNAVCPGHTRTAMADQFVAAQADPDTFLKDFVQHQHPLGRMAEPEEIGRCIRFLASDEASFITGALLPADGGFTTQ